MAKKKQPKTFPLLKALADGKELVLHDTWTLYLDPSGVLRTYISVDSCALSSHMTINGFLAFAANGNIVLKNDK